MSWKNNAKVQKNLETVKIFRRSLLFQTNELFQNSTLHGVRYITESGRPISEKVMWFCFTTTGAVIALTIIMSLWEKYQTNPTITGLDTDFHSEKIIFPTVAVCPDISYDHNKTFALAKNWGNYNDSNTQRAYEFLQMLTKLDFGNLMKAKNISEGLLYDMIERKSLRMWAFDVQLSCENFLSNCHFRDGTFPCCEYFDTIYTEHGMCFAYNSRFKSLPEMDVKTDVTHALYETDRKWALQFQPNDTAKIMVIAQEEYLGRDFNAQFDFLLDQFAEVRITKMDSFTTNDARQLSISQRKCIFTDELKLQYFPGEYTFSSCMKECRMLMALKFCKCIPPFFKPIQICKASVKNCLEDKNSNKRMCHLIDFNCLHRYNKNISTLNNCAHCDLSCSKTIYNIEQLNKILYGANIEPGVQIQFQTWPIIRYKREVLFGWIDLLVSFGGIASLFMGFSLLSGVEILYYFTMRACCMVYKNRQYLYDIEQKIKNRPPPYIDLSLKPKSHERKTLLNSSKIENRQTEKSAEISNLYPSNAGNELFVRKHKTAKDFAAYSKTLYRSPKVVTQYSDAWQPGQYLP